MTFKKITLVILPHDTDKVMQFRIPGFVFFLPVLLLISYWTFLCWILPELKIIKKETAQLNLLEMENKKKESELIHLAERIKIIALKIGEFKELDHRLKVMANLEMNEKGSDHFPVFAASSTPLMFDFSKAKTSRELIPLMHVTLDGLKYTAADSKKDKFQLRTFFKKQRKLLASTPSIYPAEGSLSSRFGYRVSPFTGEKEFHNGIDISAKIHTPVIAPANGIVSSVRRDKSYGNMIAIQHGYGLETIYAHLHNILVKKGQDVKRGETIARVGSTGLSTGPHLHYEVHLNGKAVDPFKYL